MLNDFGFAGHVFGRGTAGSCKLSGVVCLGVSEGIPPLALIGVFPRTASPPLAVLPMFPQAASLQDGGTMVKEEEGGAPAAASPPRAGGVATPLADAGTGLDKALRDATSGAVSGGWPLPTVPRGDEIRKR